MCGKGYTAAGKPLSNVTLFPLHINKKKWEPIGTVYVKRHEGIKELHETDFWNGINLLNSSINFKKKNSSNINTADKSVM